MIDFFFCIIVVAFLAMVTALVARSMTSDMRPFVWLGFFEYVGCSAAQMLWTQFVIEGGDTLEYTERGALLARYIGTDFGFVAPQVLRLLFQQQSGVDQFPGIIGAGSNTGSMIATASFLIYFLGGSQIAPQLLVGGLSFFGAIQVYNAFRDADSTLNPRWVFVATVLFPSIAFWTSAIYKESFCLIGMGACLTAWRALYRRKWVRAFIMAPLGVLLIALFRAPTIPPLALGLALYFIYERLRKARGNDVVLLGPIYLAVGLLLVVGGMILLSQIDPTLAVDKLGDTMGRKQALWSKTEGGSNIDDEEDVLPATPLEQLAHVPIALLNALFRPQIFDIHNLPTLVSAIEMTIVTYLVVRAVLRSGVRGILRQVERSPLLLMCTVIGFVGCTFVGLVTYNLGSLARYRVPFLPFYAMFILYLSRKQQAPQTTPVAGSRTAGRSVPRVSLPDSASALSSLPALSATSSVDALARRRRGS